MQTRFGCKPDKCITNAVLPMVRTVTELLLWIKTVASELKFSLVPRTSDNITFTRCQHVLLTIMSSFKLVRRDIAGRHIAARVNNVSVNQCPVSFERPALSPCVGDLNPKCLRFLYWRSAILMWVTGFDWMSQSVNMIFDMRLLWWP